MTSPRNVSFDILARDRTGRATRSAADNFEQLNRKLDGFGASLGKNLGTATKAVASFSASVAAVGSLAGPALTAAVAQGIASIGHGLALAGPALAVLPGIAAGLGLIGVTAKLAGAYLQDAIGPILDQTGNLQKSLGTLAAAGVQPLAKQFVELNLPVIKEGMDSIAGSINKVVLATGEWLNSTSGQETIGEIAIATGVAMSDLEGPLSRVVVAFGELIHRVTGDPIIGLADAIGRAADATARWLDSISKGDVDNAFKALVGWGLKVRDIGVMLRDVGDWMVNNQDKVKAFSDVLAGVGIALGAATGNFPAIIAGAFSLVVNHWDSVKKAFSDAAPFFSGIFSDLRNNPDLQNIWNSMKESWQGFVDSFKKETADLGPKFHDLVTELKKAWDEWGPIILAWWDGVGKPVFSALGTAVGFALVAMVDFATEAATGLAVLGAAFKVLWSVVSAYLGFIINGAAAAFAWIPGLGPKLVSAANDFNAFRDRVNNALDGINKHVDVTVAYHYQVFGKPGTEVGGINGSAFKGLATGGAAPGGREPFWVGEHGPELMWSDRSAYVSTAQQSRALASGGGGGGGGGVSLELAGGGGGGSVERMFAEVIYGMVNAGQLRLRVAGDRVVTS